VLGSAAGTALPHWGFPPARVAHRTTRTVRRWQAPRPAVPMGDGPCHACAPSPSCRVAICPSREKSCCSGVRLRARALSLSQRYEELRTKDDERHDDGKLLLGFTWMAPSTQEPSSLLPQQLIIIIIILLLCHHHTAAYMRASPGSSTALHPP
jgi:hypothetical protein